MTEINAFGGTFRGTAEGDHGVFTESNGRVYAGKIARGFARVGVVTCTDGDTEYVECDADGEVHGRVLGCTAGGDTWYCRFEHGSIKERAVLYANGTCAYDGKACTADYAPFVALQAMVVPIKARPPLVPPQPPFFLHAAFAPTARQSVPIGHCFGTRRSWRRPTPTRCALAASAISLHGPCGTATAKQMHRASNLDDPPPLWRMRSAPFRRLCTRSEPPCASAFSITCRTPSGSVVVCGGLHV